VNGGALVLAAGAAAVAAAINSAAGGGSFVSFPTLVFLGVPPIGANATNSVAMWVGGAGSIGGYRDLLEHPSAQTRAALLTCLLGGVTGGLLLLHTPAKTFSAAIPWLLLFSTLLFALGPLLLRLGGRSRAVRELPYAGLLPLFFVSVYGGFFGGGQGFLLLALFVLLGFTDLQRANALKIVLSFVNNGVPLIPFVIARAVTWDAAAAMCAGALVGGYYGAKLVRRIPPAPLRWTIVALGAVMTVVFFRRG
jgi:uncharacterized membrane protein YfcA